MTNKQGSLPDYQEWLKRDYRVLNVLPEKKENP